MTKKDRRTFEQLLEKLLLVMAVLSGYLIFLKFTQ